MRHIFSENQVRRLISGFHAADQKAWVEEVAKINTKRVPRRQFLLRLPDKGGYILPLKQSVVKDARLMPGTRVMLALLTGWAGTGRTLELTQGRIARHLRRSVRQVYRYLQDAAREGYLTYTLTKNRLGYIVGIQIRLDFQLLRAKPKRKEPARPANPRNPARTHESDINENIFNSTTLSSVTDPELAERLSSFQQAIRSRATAPV